MKLAFAMPHLIELAGRTQPWEFTVDGPAMTRLAKLADQWGYDMLSVPEHFLIPNDHVALSGPHHFHAYAGMGHMAGATEAIRVNSSIAILPLQHPAVTAKALSTIDWMSGGRITVTFAVGWLKEEFDLLGVPFRERGAMADEYLAAIIELWTSDAPVFEGKYVSFRDAAFEPKCHAPSPERPHLPIWMHGDADAALRRAAPRATPVAGGRSSPSPRLFLRGSISSAASPITTASWPRCSTAFRPAKSAKGTSHRPIPPRVRARACSASSTGLAGSRTWV